MSKIDVAKADVETGLENVLNKVVARTLLRQFFPTSIGSTVSSEIARQREYAAGVSSGA